MFTVEQIIAAHSKVKSGADFPAYIQDIKKLGVSSYETFVTDGHTDYSGAENYKTSSQPKYFAMEIAETCNKEQFTADLKAHQQGKSSFLEFIGQSARNGVDKWSVSLDKMTCTYFDKAGNVVLVEEIPS